jgi:GTP cyclohydrolase I/GTP cyclohydrolase-4
MEPTTIPATADVQASAPTVHVSLSRVGVTNVEKVIRIAHAGSELLYYADIDCYVDLDPDQKGVHMSRFPETVAESIDQVVIGEALHVEDLAQHIAEHIIERQRAVRSEVTIRAKFPITRRAPVSDLPTQEIYHLIGHALANGSGPRRMVGVEVRGLNACPCAQGLIRERASERLADAGYDDAQIEEIFSMLPAATHNQRAEATLMIGTKREIDARDLIGIAENSMSAPVFELLKRPDELFVVEHAHLHPRFVEDSVRLMVAGTLERYPDLSDGCFLLARQVNHETIHNHDVLAERQHDRIGVERLEDAGWARVALLVELHLLDRQGAVADLLDGREPLDQHAFLERLFDLEIVRRHALARAPVDDDGLGGAKALCSAGDIDGSVAAAVDDHPAAEHRRLLALH